MTFEGNPGSNGSDFTITCDDLLLQASEEDLLYINFTTELKLVVNFWDCLDGEVVANGLCDVCVDGSYSLGLNQETCLSCPELANCTNGFQIQVNSGYWRATKPSMNIYKCPNKDSCLGGYAPVEPPVNCKKGYGGILCT